MMRRLIAASLVIPAVVTISVSLADTNVLEDVKEMAALANAKVTLDQAIAAATSTIYPGGRVLKAGVDTKNGVPSYVIDLERNGKHTVLVNIRTGEVKTTALDVENRTNRLVLFQTSMAALASNAHPALIPARWWQNCWGGKADHPCRSRRCPRLLLTIIGVIKTIQK